MTNLNENKRSIIGLMGSCFNNMFVFELLLFLVTIIIIVYAKLMMSIKEDNKLQEEL